MIDGIPFEPGFKPLNFKLLCHKNDRNKVICFEGEWKGKKTWSIMNVWLNNDAWAPGKGIQVGLEQKAELIKALSQA